MKNKSVNGQMATNTKNEDDGTEYDTDKNHSNKASNGVRHIIGFVAND